jgi:hypothetical protein
MRLGVVVPCRDEAGVLARRIANLATVEWPALPAGARHRCLVVDDGSTDGTLLLAERLLAERFAPEGAVAAAALANGAAPGKAGAIATALRALGETVDLVVLTDADVVMRRDALVELARAFAREPELALACGAQEIVRDLAPDGGCRGADGGTPVDASGAYDRWTARVRRLESRFGRLFNAHGQLLAWRAGLGLAPTPGIAADDLDLVLAARARAGRVRLVGAARFLEPRCTGRARERQALRRARAWFQALHGRALPPEPDLPGALQRAFYRTAPAAAPLVLLLAAAGAVAGAWAWWGVGGVLFVAAVGGLALASPQGRGLVRLARVIRAARTSGAHGLSDRWEMQRS